MKLEILREHLDKAASLVAKVTNKNLSLPVLSCAVFVVENGKAVLRATNLDLSIEANLKAKVISEGTIAVPAHVLTQTISALSEQKVTLKVSGNNLVIEGERGTTSITLVDPREFPTLPYVKEGTGVSVRLPSKDFISTARMVAFAASTSSVKPEQAAVSFTLEKGELIAAATDSFRLAEIRIPLKVKESFHSVLIPARNISEIIRAAESGGEVEMRVGDNQCTFAGEFGYLTSRTIDATFPDYRAIIPKESVASATMLREDVIRAFRKISIFTDSFNQVHIALHPSEKSLTVRSLNAAVGETIDHIPAAAEGEDIDINFNARYITDALSVISGDSVTFAVAGAGRPMVITPTGDKYFTYLVMPMNR